MKKAIFPGSFDPITNGHVDVIERALPIFDEIIIAIGINSNKKYMFSLEKREEFVTKTFKDNPKVSVQNYKGLTIDFCKHMGASFILRGLRNSTDFEFEKNIAYTNRSLSSVETVFLLTSIETSFISSSIVRDVISNQGNFSHLVPNAVVFS